MNPKKTRANEWLQDQQKFSLFLQLSTDDPLSKRLVTEGRDISKDKGHFRW